MREPLSFDLVIDRASGVQVDIQTSVTPPPPNHLATVWPSQPPMIEAIRYTFTSTHDGGRLALIDAASKIINAMDTGDRVRVLSRITEETTRG